jgi:hypothetical protein
MRFSLKDLMWLVTFACVFMTGIAGLRTLSSSPGIPFQDRRILTNLAMLAVYGIPCSLGGALIGMMFGRANQGAALGLLVVVLYAAFTFAFPK